ncbi:cytochrome P450 [Sphingosinicella xenopeptidilytica]|uniref:Cytochrome P450 n=1 Tax=Sphingosinicella xenopeptidilytica TaxID=364098 RepID=A0ABW3C8Y3_SPHXN
MSASAATIDADFDVNFADPAFLADPWTPLTRLQEEAPVFFSRNQGGWVISRHEDVRACYADRRLSAARGDQFFRGMPPEILAQTEAVRAFNRYNVNRMDGRDHTRVRALLLRAFDAGAIRKVEQFIGEVVEDVLDECGRLGKFEFLETVSAVLPTRVMQRLFGLPDEYRPLLFNLASQFTSASSAAAVTPELLIQLDKAIRAINAVFDTFIPLREKEPGDDLISMMVHARDGLNKLSHEEMLYNLVGLVVAGAETTAHSLATQTARIARDPALTQRLRDDPDCAFALTTELLRYPGTVKCMTRYAAEDIELRGQKIAKGDLIWIMNAGANVDTRVFSDPFTTIIDRPNARDSMAFGPGLHFCIGHLLARTELAEFLKRAFRRFDIAILQDDVEMLSSYIFYGFRSLDVRFTAR